MGAIARYDWIAPAEGGTNEGAVLVNSALLVAYRSDRTMQTLQLSAGGALAGNRRPASDAVDYSPDMLQRTIPADSWPDRYDYLAIARIAHDMRTQYIASLLSRAKHALAERFARRARGARSPLR